MSSTNELALKVMYTDSSTGTLKLPDVPEANLANIKTRVQTINSNLENNQDQDFAQTFVSKLGNPIMTIATATITKTTEEVIYSG